MISLTPYDILVYNDIPQLFFAEDSIGVKYVCMEVESSSNELEYIAISISQKKLKRFTTGKIDLRNIFQEPETKTWYKVSYSSSYFNAEMHNFSDVDEKYLPLEGFYYPTVKPEISLEEVTLYKVSNNTVLADMGIEIVEAGPNISAYIKLMREQALYFTLEPTTQKFEGTVSAKDATTLLDAVPKSFKEYCKNSFYQKFKTLTVDLNKIEKSFNDIWEYINFRICDLGYSSFKVALSSDIMNSRELDKDVLAWKTDIVNNYKNEVIDNDFSSQADALIISDKFPDPEIRKRIFEPIIKLIENKGTKLKVSDYNQNLDRRLRIGKKQKEIIIPSKTIAEIEAEKFPDRQIVHFYVEVPNNKSIEESLSKKQIVDGLLFSQITDEFPFVIEKVEYLETTIELNSPLYLHAFLKNNLYTIDVDALDIHIASAEKTNLIELFHQEFVAKCKFYSQLPQSSCYEEYGKVVKSIFP